MQLVRSSTTASRELHKAVNLKTRGVSEKAKALWSMRDAKANEEVWYDRSSE